MKPVNLKRNIATILLISLLLQSCGVDAPAGEFSQDRKPAVMQGGPVAEGREISSATPEVLGEIQPLQIDSAPGTEGPSQVPSTVSSTNPSLGTTSLVDTSAQPTKISDDELLHYVSDSSLKSTQELIEAFNNTQKPGEAMPLRQWIEAYVGWFRREKNPKEDQLLEYACLAQIKPRTPQDQALLYDYFTSLVNKIPKRLVGYWYLIEALASVLQEIDTSTFGGTTADLITVGDWLLTKLDASGGQIKLDKANYPRYQTILSALHSTLLLIRKIDTEGWSKTRNRALYDKFQRRIIAIKQSTDYYPYIHYSHLLSKSLTRLLSQELQWDEQLEKIWQGCKALSKAVQVVQKLATLDIDLEAAEKASMELKQTYVNLRSGLAWVTEELYGDKSKISWYEHLAQVSRASMDVLQDPNHWDAFIDKLRQITGDKGILLGEYPEDRRALQYSVISQLTLLALHSAKRSESLEELRLLTGLNIWHQDLHLMEGLIEGLETVARQDKRYILSRETSQAKAYLEELKCQTDTIRSERKPNQNSWLCCIALPQPVPPLVQAMTTWLGNKSVEEKLAESHPMHRAVQNSSVLFGEVKSGLAKAVNDRLTSPLAILPQVSSIREALVKHYSKEFRTLPSLLELEKETEIPTSSVACQLWRHEEVREQPSTSTAKADNDSETGVEERDDEPIEAGSEKYSVLGNLNHMGRQVTSKAPRAMPRLS
ncbi:MAG: hypothetical protein AAF706_01725, partial [Bacteroidota bacterium]